MSKAFAVSAVFAAMLFASLAAAAMSWDATWDEVCGDNCCVEGRPVNFTITIENTGDTDLLVDTLRVEFENGSVAATWGKKDSKGTNLSPGEDDDFLAKGTLPRESDDPADYTVCIYAIYLYTDNVTIKKEWLCASDYSTMEFTEWEDFECMGNDDCAANQRCDIDESKCEAECVNLTRGSSCGNFSNHHWVNYACCSDSACQDGKYCINHICQAINCPCGQIVDHQCQRYDCCADRDCPANYFCNLSSHQCRRYECSVDRDCGGDEKCESRLCAKVQCSGCRYAKDHACMAYECCEDSECADTDSCQSHKCAEVPCPYGKYPKEHSCASYECMESASCGATESCVDHNCAALSCKTDEKAGNHACARIGCGLLQYPKNHQCLSYFSGEGLGDNPLPAVGIIVSVLAIILLSMALFVSRSKAKPKEIPKAGKPLKRPHGRGQKDVQVPPVAPPSQASEDEDVAAIKKAVAEQEKAEKPKSDTAGGTAKPAEGQTEAAEEPTETAEEPKD